MPTDAMTANTALSSIHPDAKIAEGVVIGPFTTIYADVQIGAGTWIGPNVTLFDGARIGENCQIFPGAVIAAIPQDLKYRGEKTTVEIGGRTVIRECVTVNKGTSDQLVTRIGTDCLLMAYTHIAHDCQLGNHVILANGVQVAGHVVIDDHAFIGGTSAIHQFVRVGTHAMVGGGSLVRKDVPPYVKAIREPLSFGGINHVGLTRKGFSAKDLDEIQQIYRLLFQSANNLSDALRILEESLISSRYKTEISAFIQQSKRGIIRKGGFIADSEENI